MREPEYPASDIFGAADYADMLIEMDQLDTLEETLKKLNRNSLLLKIITLSLLAAALLCIDTAAALPAALGAVFGIVICWITDGFFLRRKRLSDRLYRDILKGAALAPDLAFKTLQARYPERKMKFAGCFAAREVLWFYEPFLLMAVLIAAFGRIFP